MAKKKKNWFYRLKRLFVSDTHCRPETDKSRRKGRRCGFGFLPRRRMASLLSSPAPPPEARATSDIETDDHSSRLWLDDNNVVVCGSCNSHFAQQMKDPNGKVLILSHDDDDDVCAMKKIQVLAAIKIQTAFRAYIARKALRALKGLVRLQAIIRGRNVRRQTMSTLKCLQTIVNIQSELCAKRNELMKNNNNSREKDIKIDLNSQKKWDHSPLSREEASALCVSKREAEIKRERIKEYWSTHRKSAESDQSKATARRRYWLEQWVDSQLAKRDEDYHHNPDSVNAAKARIRDQLQTRQLRFRKSQKDNDADHHQGFDSPMNVPRRSFHTRQRSFGEDTSFAGSPAVPAYMAATESARARTRSLSSPRLRPINMDAYSEINSPYKHKLSPISSINSNATSFSRMHANPTTTSLLSQQSLCLKGLPGPVKSKRSLKYHSFNSDVSIPNWDHPGSCRLYA